MATSSFTRKIVVTDKKAIKLIKRSLSGKQKHTDFPTDIEDPQKYRQENLEMLKKELFG